jgi:hypothetical protein
MGAEGVAEPEDAATIQVEQRYAKLPGADSERTRKRECAKADYYSAASLALLLFRGLPSAFFSTGARNLPV